MNIPINSPLGFIGLVLLALGLFLILAGLDVFSVQQVTVRKGQKTWGLGIVFVILGIALLYPEVSGSSNVTLTPTPTFDRVITVHGDNRKSSYAQEGYPNTAGTHSRNFFVGFDDVYDKKRNRVYLEFDLPVLPDNAIIKSSTIQIYQYVAQTEKEYAVTIYQVVEPWLETKTTWNNQPKKSQAISSDIFDMELGWKNIDIPQSVVENWYKDTTTNNGITIWADDENAPGGVFWSKYCLQTMCADLEHPRIQIKYFLSE